MDLFESEFRLIPSLQLPSFNKEPFAGAPPLWPFLKKMMVRPSGRTPKASQASFF